MRKFYLLILLCGVIATMLKAQDQPVYPSVIRTGTFLGVSPPLRDLPAITPDEFRAMELNSFERNEGLELRSYPFAATAYPKGQDPSWQKDMGTVAPPRAPLVNVEGQPSPYFPPDANGAVGPNHYMQTINCVYAIYNKSGTLVAGPTNINTLFSGLPGATYNDGDPIVLYDEQADRWFVAEFSISGTNDYMLIAVSTTNDPTGSWNKYSFDVDDMPDYMKFGIWQDGYYMGVNNGSTGKKDIYVFQRSVMINGGASPLMMGFDNNYRPASIDGFMCVPPVDNDGAFAPAGSPGLFISFNDDAIGGGSDQLWLYALTANWTTPSSSTFVRTAQINVPAFDCNFGANWDNIKQPGTNKELDGVPQVIMNAPQYRNFGTYQTIVCCHTVDVDNTDHAGIRWYELRNTSGSWTLRQSGTYAPDAHSRWMGSIRMNGQRQIGLGYSISSTSIYPGIRYTGQSTSANDAGSGVMDMAEQVVFTGANVQTAYNRWGDYSGLAVDPVDDNTFWYTNQYVGASQARNTRISSFQVGSAAPLPDLIVNSQTVNPTTTLAGSSIAANCTLQNQGTASAVASTLGYYLSTDLVKGNDVSLGSFLAGSLGAGATQTINTSLTIPANTAAGNYYILFVADDANTVSESNENNNVSYASVQVTVPSGPGCNSTTKYPTSTLTPATTWKTQRNIPAGTYAAFNVTAGQSYTFSYCTADGGKATYNSEITLRDNSGNYIEYANDICGDDAYITWVATYTGVVRVVTTQYPCASNNLKATLAYRNSTAKTPGNSKQAVSSVNVFPNPTDSKVYVESPDGFGNVTSLLVYNISGKLISRRDMNQETETVISFDLSDQPAGYYILELVSGEEIRHFKVIKSK